jgi:hypothetical protein
VCDAGGDCGGSIAVSHLFLRVFLYPRTASSSCIALNPSLPVPKVTDLEL